MEIVLPESVAQEVEWAKVHLKRAGVTTSVDEIILNDGISGLRCFNNGEPFTEPGLAPVPDGFSNACDRVGIKDDVLVPAYTLAHMFGVDSSTIIHNSSPGKKFHGALSTVSDPVIVDRETGEERRRIKTDRKYSLKVAMYIYKTEGPGTPATNAK